MSVVFPLKFKDDELSLMRTMIITNIIAIA